MRLGRIIGAATAAMLVALIAPVVQAAAPTITTMTTGAQPTAHHSRASLHIDVGRTSGWIGQAIPVTVRAQFRDVDGVTLEGAPQLTSDSIFTSTLAREPRQSTVVVDGTPVLVASWSGTVTPSTAGPLALAVELPVHLRYHEAAAAPAFADGETADPFSLFNGMDIDPADPSSVQRLFRSFEQSFSRGFEQPLGRAHDETTTLKAASHPFEIHSLPTAGQPPGFSGAVGRFDIRASMAASDARASEPTTLTVAVQGDGDLDRVNLPGIQSSRDWKAYPATAKIDAGAPGKRIAQKTFEQVLIPVHGGELTVPAISLSVFDPVAGKYTTVETAPLTIDVQGPPAPAAPAMQAAPAVPTPVLATAGDPPASLMAASPSPGALVVSPRTLALRLAPVLAVILASVVIALLRRRDEEKALRRALRLTAKRGSGPAFFDAARKLIVMHFAKRWGVTEKEVTPDALRKQLGDAADPLVAAITTADALRFGRRDLETTELRAVCSSIESSLRDAA